MVLLINIGLWTGKHPNDNIKLTLLEGMKQHWAENETGRQKKVYIKISADDKEMKERNNQANVYLDAMSSRCIR